jgi:hypothetical protein
MRIEPKKLHVVLRTCDKVSLVNDRIVPKFDCIKHCLTSLVKSLSNNQVLDWQLYIIDDRSSQATREEIQKIAPMAEFIWLPERDDEHLPARLKSRYSVSVEYDLIYKLPTEDLIYVVEDDYLHYPDSISIMLNAWGFFSSTLKGKDVGIFPQDFQQLHASPKHDFNVTYCSTPCYTLIGPDRYYRTTWYTHESFLLQGHVFHKFKDHFDSLLEIGKEDDFWEGNTISKVWTDPSVVMLMPMPTIAIHVSAEKDIPFYVSRDSFFELWEQNREY